MIVLGIFAMGHYKFAYQVTQPFLVFLQTNIPLKGILASQYLTRYKKCSHSCRGGHHSNYSKISLTLGQLLCSQGFEKWPRVPRKRRVLNGPTWMS